MSLALSPVTLTPGIAQSVNLPNPNSIQNVKLTNGTPFDITYSGFGVQGSSIIPAGTEYMLHSEILNVGYVNMTAVNNVNVTGTGVANLVVYFQDEPQPKGTWPISVPTQIVQAKVSTVTTLVNDGSSVGTQIIESTPSGAPSSTISILNDGTVTIKGDVAGVLTTLLQLLPGAAGGTSSVILSDASRTTEVLGKLSVDGTASVTGASTFTGDATFNGASPGIKVANNAEIDGNCNVNANLQLGNASSVFRLAASIFSSDNNLHIVNNSDNNKGYWTASNQTTNLALFDGANSLINIIQDFLLTNGKLGVAAAGDVLDASSSTATYLKARSAGNILFQSPNGSTNFTFDNTGKMSCNQVSISGAGGQYGFLAGNISRVSSFTGSGSGTYNHNLGATPSIVIPICTSTNSSATQGFDSGNATQVHVTMGAVVNFTAWCFHT